ncbi:protein PLANT CADMIUM RESISTANCE 2 isoform X1 [Arachis duranensis]|uniref:Protein PLANT CADMIUM RESISTANCE 2 isoform X1 n=1 Tax=Arachis duranensis TaxID=130453 RepID=A0A9C6WRC0_ARADU|nr:protein PLANT CADMIUM RESISTANCE 2 isoform X1 [Arachis duranensis]
MYPPPPPPPPPPPLTTTTATTSDHTQAKAPPYDHNNAQQAPPPYYYYDQNAQPPPPPPPPYFDPCYHHHHHHHAEPPPPPPMYYIPNPMLPLPIYTNSEKVEWSTGLFDCLSDIKNCLITCLCPCFTFGQIAEMIDRDASSCAISGALYAMILFFIGSPCLYSCIYRTRMRRQFLLKETLCLDCIVHFFCEPCALCQEYRELQNRGFDMSLGWNGNLDRWNNQMASHQQQPPPVLNMTR